MNMMSSDDPTAKAQAILQGIQASMETRPWTDIVDEGIQRALERLVKGPYPSTSREVIAHVGETLFLILSRTSREPRVLSPALLYDEAAHLIGYGVGFPAAVAGAKDRNTAALEVMYLRVGELLKERFRSAQVRWAFTRHLGPCDWDTKKAIAELLLSRIRADMPKDAPALYPEMFADCIPDLFFHVQETENAPLSILLNRAFSTGP